ncbi:xyloglucan O-acetyltransferase 4-like [Arachis duranensis]|uniref:Xyloglucan O-acetyltransferase 4-like n=1 Tax=Arachis duranensis TaxID=130453 RepID=A0A6P5M8U8_ARADU|nr:xyloglucan O-acetyltransferase 4-like [Arachis duranensis]
MVNYVNPFKEPMAVRPLPSSFFILYSPNASTVFPNQRSDETDESLSQNNDEEEVADISEPNTPSENQYEEKTCDLFKGHWVPTTSEGSTYYTNSSCRTIPDSKNCFKHGRTDSDFLNWRWKPEQCELPRFDHKMFLELVRGKKMAFIGDSVSRNHMESLLCLLSQEETPKDIHKDSEDRYRTWYFPKHDFTLMMLWSRFIIVGEEQMINGSASGTFDLQLDKVDDDWARELPNLDYAIISGGHWFFRVMYLHEGDNLVGCVYCGQPNVTSYNSDFPLRKAFRTAFNYINNGCKECGKLVTVLRTFAPAHFENGAWNTGGYCNRTGPASESEVDPGMFEWQVRNAQMEEFEKARKEGMEKGKSFEVLDVTVAMMMRPDGHPGDHWGNKWMRGYNDCTHWCLPGPVDLWSELLLAILNKLTNLSSPGGAISTALKGEDSARHNSEGNWR